MKFNKKLLSIIVLSIMLLSLLCVGSFAAKTKATLSEDLKTVYYNEQTFICIPDVYVDSMLFEFKNSEWNTIEFNFSPQQKNHMTEYYTEAYYTAEDELYILELMLYFKSGTHILTYINEKYGDEFIGLTERTSEDAVVEVYSQYTYNEEYVPTKVSSLKSGPSSIVQMMSIYSYEHMTVYLTNKTREVLLESGIVLRNDIDESYYYLDYKENDILSLYDLDPYTTSELKIYEISDSELIESIENAYNSEEYDDALTDEELASLANVSVIFGSFLLCGCAIAFAIIFSIKSKKAISPFRTIYKCIVIICAVIFVLTLVLLLMMIL